MPKPRTVYDYAVVPYKSIGPIRLGMTASEVREAMSPYRAKQRTIDRLPADWFHGFGLTVTYLDGTAQEICISDGGDIWGRIELRPRYLRKNGVNLFGHRPAKVLSLLSQDTDCDPFVKNHPGSYCATEFGLVLEYCDSEDYTFGHLALATKEWFKRFSVQHRVKDIVSRKRRRTT
jgi:hypothetical protein